MAEQTTPINPLELEPSDSAEYEAAMLKYADEIALQNDPNSIYYGGTNNGAVGSGGEPAPVSDNSNSIVASGDNDGNGSNRPPADPNLDLIPEKFRKAKDPYKALAKAYAELEAKLGKQKPAEPATPPAGGSNGEPNATPPANSNVGTDAANKAGLKFDDLVDHYQTFGELSEEQYNALAAVGFDKSVVETYIAGQEAIAREQRNALFADVGGETKANELLAWAGTNLSKERVTELNDLLATNDPKVVKFVLNAIAVEHKANQQPSLISSTVTTNASTSESFRSEAEAIKAMSDPRYQEDPVYRKEVEQKLLKSSLFK